ncbi:MAG: lactate utilization protein [Lachnospirales bacterium]
MSPKEKFADIMGENLIKNLEKRNIKGYYAKNKEEALNLALSLIPENSSVSYGGSMTINEIGLMDKLKEGNYNFIDRALAKTPEQTKEIYHKALNCDYYIMSSNAITKEGELVNIDGNGNRVAALIYGPENVIVIVGINKLVSDVKEAYKRIKNIACPINTLRLNKKTPCAITGSCGDCYGDGCICSHTVITRRSGIKDRIKVIFVGESLGY